jgi:hypothetical protein
MDTPENICKFVMNPGTETDIKMMNKMLRDGLISSPNVKCKKWYNGTALMYQSSFNGTFEAMEFLINKGAHVNLINDWRETALYWAVGCTKETGLREKSFLLLREHAKVLGLKNTSGLTLIEACDNQDMKEILKQKETEEIEAYEMYKNKMTEDAEKHAKIKETFIEEERQRERQRQNLVEAEREQKQTLAKAEAKASSDPDEKEYKQTIEMTRFKGGKTKKTRRKRRKTRKYKKSRKSRKSRR